MRRLILPKSVPINGVQYPVVTSRRLVEDFAPYLEGYVDKSSGHGPIELAPGLRGRSREDTFLHECLHALFGPDPSLCSVAEEERIIRHITPGLLELVRGLNWRTT